MENTELDTKTNCDEVTVGVSLPAECLYTFKDELRRQAALVREKAASADNQESMRKGFYYAERLSLLAESLCCDYKPVDGKPIRAALTTLLQGMLKEGAVRMEVHYRGKDDWPNRLYVVTGVSDVLINAKNTIGGVEHFQMYLVAGPTAELWVRMGANGLLEVRVSSTDHNSGISYSFHTVRSIRV